LKQKFETAQSVSFLISASKQDATTRTRSLLVSVLRHNLSLSNILNF